MCTSMHFSVLLYLTASKTQEYFLAVGEDEIEGVFCCFQSNLTLLTLGPARRVEEELCESASTRLGLH